MSEVYRNLVPFALSNGKETYRDKAFPPLAARAIFLVPKIIKKEPFVWLSFPLL